MRRLIALALPATVCLPAAICLPVFAQSILSEATGNWAGPSNQGFYFRAQLTQAQDMARLQIWGGDLNAVPAATGAPEFDNDQIALSAFATLQELEVFDGPAGSTLQVVTEFADEEAEGRTVVQIQYLDNQYTITGYYHRSIFYNPGSEPSTYECDVDLRRMVTSDGGVERKLDPVAFDALNASDWTWDAAFERGWCTRT